MTLPPVCMARQFSDQMHCNRCNLTWDAGDPNPPPCKDPDWEMFDLERANKKDKTILALAVFFISAFLMVLFIGLASWFPTLMVPGRITAAGTAAGFTCAWTWWYVFGKRK